MRRYPFLLVLLSLLLPAVRPGVSQQAGQALPAPTPAKLSRKDFREIRWLEGKWRGASVGGKPFYEEYRVTNDSTILMTFYADSTFTRSNSTGTLELRGGELYYRSGRAVWVVTRTNGKRIDFDPVEGARNRFVWTRASKNAWTALLSFPTRPDVLYRLERAAG